MGGLAISVGSHALEAVPPGGVTPSRRDDESRPRQCPNDESSDDRGAQCDGEVARPPHPTLARPHSQRDVLLRGEPWMVLHDVRAVVRAN
jgi:hypothetical protein